MTPTRYAALALACSAACHASAAEADVARLSWLAGCWKATNGEPGSVEQWLPPAGGNLLGVSRTVRQGKTVSYEFMRIAADASGTLAFHAQPSGQEVASFAVVELGDTSVVFENAKHDFPQRIAYAADGADKLLARIEGMRNGALRVIPFPMTRVSCDGLAKER